MVEKTLTKTKQGFRGVEIFEDLNDNIKTTGVAVDDDNYDTSTFLDRDYDVRAVDAFIIKVENIDPADGITLTVLTTTKDYDIMNTDLVDADFSETGLTEESVAAGAKSTTYKLVVDSPEITAVRLRAKRQTTLLDSLARADIRSFINTV